MNRRCCICGTAIHACMGMVNYTDFYDAMEGIILPTEVRETCGTCVERQAEEKRREELTKMNLFKFFCGGIELSSGETTYFKIDCDALVRDDLETLAWLIRRRVGRFGSVVGVPRGGIAIAEALESYVNPKSPAQLIVDDVLTTGKSMQDMKEVAHVFHDDIKGAVIFARGKCPDWITPIFQMTDEPDEDE